MDLILDTCALLSLVGLTKRRLSPDALGQIRIAEEVGVSACTMFEIAIKHKKRGMNLGAFANPAHFWNTAIKEYQLTELAVRHDVFYQSVLLPDHHADPFDRIIIAHARQEGIPVVTFDPVFSEYDVTVCA
jgi:PIN domain nuclease of toxin-antitoxin system